jgi:hypothetical protein
MIQAFRPPLPSCFRPRSDPFQAWCSTPLYPLARKAGLEAWKASRPGRSETRPTCGAPHAPATTASDGCLRRRGVARQFFRIYCFRRIRAAPAQFIKASFARRAWMLSPSSAAPANEAKETASRDLQERAQSVVNARLSMHVSRHRSVARCGNSNFGSLRVAAPGRSGLPRGGENQETSTSKWVPVRCRPTDAPSPSAKARRMPARCYCGALRVL